MTNAIDAAIKKAQELNQNAASVPAVSEETSGNSVAHYSAPAKMKTMDDLGSAGFDVDTFLEAKSEDGFKVKGKNGLFDSIRVAIDATDGKGIQVFEGIRYGNPAVYKKTFDGYKEAQGGLWSDAVKQAQRVDPAVRTYEGADLTMVALEEVKNAKGEVIVSVGDRIGHSTAVTTKANLKALTDAISAAGLRGKNVEVIVKHDKRTNKNGQSWGVPLFELVGEIEESDAE